MEQAKIVDIHRYYRSGGVDWGKLKANCDAVIISAGVGLVESPLLREQVRGAQDHDVPYATYHIPSPNAGSMSNQAAAYLNGYGVRDALTCIDVEPPSKNVRCVNSQESLAYIHHIEDRTARQPLVYSNPKYIKEALGNPAWLKEYWLWIAQWLYRIWLLTFYPDFDTFLAKYACAFPPYVRGTALLEKTVLWQFSAKGDAQRLCASALTQDPIYRYGIKDADLDISTIPKDNFLNLLGLISPSPEPPPEPAGIWYRVPVSARNVRKTPNSITGAVVLTLHTGDEVLVSELVTGVPGQWGRTLAYRHCGVLNPLIGYIYMNSLVKLG
jgi:GH25 family lysozyme M1 (1,4-beta-N-acetylmuramidase)